MNKAVDSEVRDNIVRLCGMGVDYYEVVDTETATVVYVNPCKEYAIQVKDKMNRVENTDKYGVGFVNN